MMRYDMNERVETPSPIEFNDMVVTCVRCGREVPADNAIKQIRIVRWLDWDNPDENEQGQYQQERHTEWYCCGAEGFGTMDCAEHVLAQGIDAQPRSLRFLAGSVPLGVEVNDQARNLLRQQAEWDRDAMALMADLENIARYDDHSPGQIGGGI